MGQKGLLVFAKHPGAHLVAGGPVVHIGQEILHRLHAGFKILHLAEKEGVEVVLFKKFVGQRFQKFLRLAAAPKGLCQLPQRRRAHADNALRGHIGDESCLKGGKLLVPEGKKGLSDAHLTLPKRRSRR